MSSLSDGMAQLRFVLASLALQGDPCRLKPLSGFTVLSIHSIRKVEPLPGD